MWSSVLSTSLQFGEALGESQVCISPWPGVYMHGTLASLRQALAQMEASIEEKERKLAEAEVKREKEAECPF